MSVVVGCSALAAGVNVRIEAGVKIPTANSTIMRTTIYFLRKHYVGGKKAPHFFKSPMKAPHYSHFLFVFSSILRLFLTSLLLCHFDEAKTNNKMFPNCETTKDFNLKLIQELWFSLLTDDPPFLHHHHQFNHHFFSATHLHSSACLEATCSHLDTSSDTSPGR